MTRPSKPGSKRGKVRAAFDKKGEAEAFKIGALHGVRESKVRRWIKLWTGVIQPSRKSPAAAAFEEVKKRRRTGDPSPAEAGDKVALTWNLDWVGRLIGRGPEQSVIKFPNGNERTVSNDWYCKV